MAYKILTVDDSRTIRMIVKKAFKPYNCELFEAENGVEGLAAASKVMPDLIVLDITMPVMTGIEMLGRLKEEVDLKNIPVIMLTAESGKDNVMQIVKMGVKDYIVKPFKGEQLIDRVTKILKLTKTMEANSANSAQSGPNYFNVDGQFVILAMPQKISRSVGARVESALKEKIGLMDTAGLKKMIVDIGKVADVNMTAIQLIISVVNTCVRAKITSRVVASESQTESLKSFHETSAIEVDHSIEEAMSAL